MKFGPKLTAVLSFLLTVGGIYLLFAPGRPPISPITAIALVLITALTALIFSACTLTLVRSRATKRFNASLSLLNDGCDPQRYIQSCQSFIKPGAKPSLKTATASHNLAVGYFAQGDLEGAIKLEEELLHSPQCSENPLLKCIVLSTLSNIYFCKEDVRKGAGYLRELEEMGRSLPDDELHQQQLRQLTGLPKTQLQVAKGELEEPLAWFKARIQQGLDEYGRVSNHYQLALVYEKLGDLEGCRQSLQYVLQHGGKLHLRELAEKKLNNL